MSKENHQNPPPILGDIDDSAHTRSSVPSLSPAAMRRALLLTALISPSSGWIWDTPVISGTLPGRVGATSAVYLPPNGFPEIVQCGGSTDTTTVSPTCTIVRPYRGWSVSPLTVTNGPGTIARYDHTCSNLGRNYLYFWGGHDAQFNASLDCQVLEMGTWQIKTLDCSYPEDSVVQRWGHTSVVFSIGGTTSMMVYGGADTNYTDVQDGDSLALLQLLTFNQPTPSLLWTRLIMANETNGLPPPSPPARHYHSSVLYPHNTPRYMLMTGGRSFITPTKLKAQNDMWQLDLASCAWGTGDEVICTNGWVQRTPLGLPASGFYGHNMVVTQLNTVVLLGGTLPSPPILTGTLSSYSAADSVSFSSPAVEGSAPVALFRSATVLADTNEDLKEEMLILGGSTDSSLAPPSSSQVFLLADLDVTYAGLSKELPYILTGAGVAVLFLVMLGVYAWRRSAKKEEGWAAGFARFSPYFSGRGGGEESELLRVGDADALLEDTKRFNYGGLETIGGGGDPSPSTASAPYSALAPMTPSLSVSRGGAPGTAASRKSSMRSRAASRSERAERNLVELLGEEDDEDGRGGVLPEDTVRF